MTTDTGDRHVRGKTPRLDWFSCISAASPLSWRWRADCLRLFDSCSLSWCFLYSHLCINDLTVSIRRAALPEDVPASWSGSETQQLSVSYLVAQQRQTPRLGPHQPLCMSSAVYFLVPHFCLLCFSSGCSFTLGESGRSESRTTLRSPKEERPEVIQLRKVSTHTSHFFPYICCAAGPS